MRSRHIVATLFVLLCGAGSASAQALSLEFHDGLVRLKADNVPVSRILAEWTRIGGTRIVHGERVPGAPLTLEITDVPERQALEIVLRGAAGYMVLARETTPAGASTFDKILVLPTTTRAAAAPSPPQPPPQVPPPPFPERTTSTTMTMPIKRRHAAAARSLSAGTGPERESPSGLPPPTQQPAQHARRHRRHSSRRARTSDDDPAERPEPAPPPPGNPFGVVPGGARPGTITPAPPQQREPNPGQQPR